MKWIHETSTFDPDEPTSVRQKLDAPVVLVVGCAPRFVKSCRDVLAMANAIVADCSVDSYKSCATRLWPAVIVMSEPLYVFDPDGFSEIAVAIGSTLIRVPSEEISVDSLNTVLIQAVFKAMPRRESFER